MTWEQVPKILYNAVTAIEDQHFDDHWGVDFPARCRRPPTRNILKHRKAEGASTITMQLAGNLFPRPQRPQLPPQSAGDASLPANRTPLHPSRKFSPCTRNQVYLAHGNYGLCRRFTILFSAKNVTDLNLQQAALLAGNDFAARSIRRFRTRRAPLARRKPGDSPNDGGGGKSLRPKPKAAKKNPPRPARAISAQ